MRVTQILLPALLALATAACAQQQIGAYTGDPATHRGILSGPRNAAAPYGQPQYAQAGYQPAAAADSGGRGLFSSSPPAAPSYAQTNGRAAQPPVTSHNRGLLTAIDEPTVPSYPLSAYPQQAYAQPPAAQPAYAPNGLAQRQAQAYARPQYPPQQYPVDGRYAAAQTAIPSRRRAGTSRL